MTTQWTTPVVGLLPTSSSSSSLPVSPSPTGRAMSLTGWIIAAVICWTVVVCALCFIYQRASLRKRKSSTVRQDVEMLSESVTAVVSAGTNTPISAVSTDSVSSSVSCSPPFTHPTAFFYSKQPPMTSYNPWQPPPPYEEALRMCKPPRQCDVISESDDVIADDGHVNIVVEPDVELSLPDCSSTARDDGVFKKIPLDLNPQAAS